MPDNATPTQPRHWLLVSGLTFLCLIVAVIVALVLVHPGEVSTNDAQIDGHIHPVNTRVAGTITWVNSNVEDTRYVEAGTVLARLDPNDYQPMVSRLEGDEIAAEASANSAVVNLPITSAAAKSRLSSARAAVADAEDDLKGAEAQKVSAEAAVTQARATYRRAEDDRVRYAALVDTHEISRSEYDQRFTDSATTAATLLAAQANSSAADQKIASARERIQQRKSDLVAAETAPQTIEGARLNIQRASGELKRSKAALLNAQLDLGYTELISPVSGVVGRKSMESGQRVNVGQLMLTIAPTNDVWVIANFRETQLHHMHVGQTAKIHVDSYGWDLNGTVESIGGATGSKYAVVPPENATGNYVKVVQRIPVRIRIDLPAKGQQPLLPGMSIEVSVNVTS